MGAYAERLGPYEGRLGPYAETHRSVYRLAAQVKNLFQLNCFLSPTVLRTEGDLQVDHLYVVSDHSVIGQYQRYWLLFNESSWSGWCTSYWLDVHNTLQTESTLLCTYSVAEIFHLLFQISFGLKTCYLPLTSIFRQSCDKHNIFRSAMI